MPTPFCSGAVGDPAFDKRRQLAVGRNQRCSRIRRAAWASTPTCGPARVWPGLEDDGPLKPHVLNGTDMLVVRELIGGLYYGEPRGDHRRIGRPPSTRIVYTRHEKSHGSHGSGFDAARGDGSASTSVDKANVLEVSRLWRHVVTDGRARPIRT